MLENPISMGEFKMKGMKVKGSGHHGMVKRHPSAGGKHLTAHHGDGGVAHHGHASNPLGFEHSGIAHATGHRCK